MSDADPEGLTDTKQSDPLATFNTKRRRGVRVTSAAAIALGLALAGGAVAGATTSTPSSTSSGPSTADHRRPMGGSPPAAVGTVASVGSDSFTLTAQDSTTVTVNVGTATTYRDAGVTTPTLANVTVGEHVAVFGTDTANAVTATGVAIGDPPGGGPGGHGPGGPGGPEGHGGPPPSGGGNGSTSTSTSG
ncbi:MAG TPA: hypothetical protein VII46_06035 [Acidimicrobiales bacterium]